MAVLETKRALALLLTPTCNSWRIYKNDARGLCPSLNELCSMMNLKKCWRGDYQMYLDEEF
jgi:hypothetical protein